MKKISILIPCYNEEKSLSPLYEALTKLMDSLSNYEWEVLLVNDGSKDKTIDIIRELRNSDPRINYVDLSRNFGKENAMLAGFDYATGDALVIMDADLQHPPKTIPEFIKYWEEGYDDVYGERITRGKESWFRKHISLFYYKLLQKSSRFDVLPNVGDFRLLDRSCINVLKQLRETDRYTKGMFAWIGFKKKAVPFETADRVAGSSSWSYLSLIKLAVEGITSFTTAPLRFSTFLGSLISLIAFLYLIFIVVKTLLFGEDVQGYPTLITTILFFSGIQLLSLGILGEYIGRIFNETKQRPTYIAKEFNGKRCN